MGKFLKAAADDLALHIRHGTWLNTVPDRRDDDKSKAPQVSRLQSMRDLAGDDEFMPPTPDPGVAAYLLDHFWSIGPTIGECQITQGELRDYQDNSGVVLIPWECSVLRRLSIEVINESNRARAHDCMAPWKPEDNRIDRFLAAKRMQAAMRALVDL